MTYFLRWFRDKRSLVSQVDLLERKLSCALARSAWNEKQYHREQALRVRWQEAAERLIVQLAEQELLP